MANVIPNREASVSAPADQSFSPTVDGHGGDKGRQPSVWPVADTPGRPFIHPHRLAQAMGDRDATYSRIHGERLADGIRSWVIVIAATFLGVVLLLTVFDRFLDGKF